MDHKKQLQELDEEIQKIAGEIYSLYDKKSVVDEKRNKIVASIIVSDVIHKVTWHLKIPDLSNEYSFVNEYMTFYGDFKHGQVQQILKEIAPESWEYVNIYLNDYTRFSIHYNTVCLDFENGKKASQFIKEHNLKVDLSNLDKRHKELKQALDSYEAMMKLVTDSLKKE